MCDATETMVAAESYVNADVGLRYGESGWQETWTDDPGAIYRAAQREFGRCTGHVYADFGGKSYAVGWVFQGRTEYEGHTRPGEPRTYLREVWISLGLRRDGGDVLAYDVKRHRAVPMPAEA